jgi:hypothetical protein
MEDEVKRQKGVSKDDGVEGSFVSFQQVCQYYSEATFFTLIVILNTVIIVASIVLSLTRV